jgi:hypothetical protein
MRAQPCYAYDIESHTHSSILAFRKLSDRLVTARHSFTIAQHFIVAEEHSEHILAHCRYIAAIHGTRIAATTSQHRSTRSLNIAAHTVAASQPTGRASQQSI